MAFPPDTTYATLAEWKKRVAIAATNTDSDGIGQQLLNDAAWVVDDMTRGARAGYEAFSASASEARVFDDDLTDSIEIDDLVGQPTLVQRGSVTISASYFKTWPYNSGNGPITKIIFRLDALINATAVATSLWYGHPFRGVGAGQISVTGTWGYCAAGNNRPAVVKEATLQIASLMYKQNALSLPDVVAMMQRDPTAFLNKPVYDRLMMLRKEKGNFFA